MKKNLTISFFMVLFFCFCVANSQNHKNYESIVVKEQQKIEKNGKLTESKSDILHQNIQIEKDRRYQYQKSLEAKPTQLNLFVRKSTRNDVATITLKVYEPWSIGTQMLIDADHQLYDKYYSGVYTGNAEAFYSDADYKIPENASLTGPVIVNGEGTVEVPEGVYDFIFLRPDDEGVYVFWWETFNPSQGIMDRAVMNDYTFLAGYEYIFTEFGNLIYFEPERDAALTEIILPQSSPDLSNQEEVKIKLKNTGVHDFTGVDLSFKVNNGTPVTESYNETLAPGEEITYTFTAKADLSTSGIHEVEAWVDYDMDMKFWNNSKTGKTEKFNMQLPFFDNFNSNASLLRWTIIDADGDGWTWRHDEVYEDTEGGTGLMQADGPWAGEGTGDDYLISNQINFPEPGTYNISFFSRGVLAIADEVEKLRILYGTSSNYEEMELLVEYEITNGWWEVFVKNFTIETPGVYHFAFHYCSTPQFLYGSLFIDNVRIAAGEYVATPDIKINKILTPLPSCEIIDGPLGAIVSNYGTAPISEFKVTIQIEDNQPVEQTFNYTIEERESLQVYFNEKLNFTEIGEYAVKLTVETPNELEEHQVNNTTETSVKVVAPVTEIPFKSNFSNVADRSYWNPEVMGGWAINYNEYYWACEERIPLLSRCVTLEPDFYRLSYTFWAGYFEATDDFYVTYGKLGTNPATWQPVKEYYDYHTGDVKMKDDITVNITEQGEYIFAFFPTRLGGTVRIYEVSLDLIPEHDFRINKIESHSFPNMIPETHCEGAKSFTVAVENRGKSMENGTIEVKYNGQIIGSKTFELSSGTSVANVDVDATINSLSLGQIALTFNVSLESGINKSLVLNKMVSDSTFAWDKIDYGFPTGIGINGKPCALGLIYELGKEDILTSINVGLFERDEDSPSDEEFGLAVYSVNNNLDLGEIVYEANFIRGIGNNESGTTFEIPNIKLLSGKYFFEIRQLYAFNVAIAFDEEADGYFYDNTDNYLNKISGFGYIHLRPNFGSSFSGISSNNISEHQLSLYPNPATGVLNVKLEDMNIDKIIITNALGKVIHQTSHINNSLYRYNTTSLSSGLYFISVQTKTETINSKFMVK